ncbi:sensor histidine kinase [Limimaricola hongkongensis]|uniref:histidine kinase n=1 Tax=Limimaricola hongkongensis DSM 17492 TaxID=1122180 RepID=A0A017HDK7_9RHOB|nr:ATP-binding protein [Limimaricola hongkongensis]EYD71884.1 Phosphate regulon sensor protein PhoR (SphS) [Limimaricola hongkongensis DSM 17492]
MTPSSLDSFAAALPIPVLLIDPSERIAAANPPALRLLGGAQVGRHYIAALRQPALLDAVEACLRDGTGGRARYLGREGSRDTAWTVTAGAVALPRGRGVALSFEDITAVEEAEAMRRDFVANVSHELRTPITALSGFIETLRGPARDDAAARERFLSIMQRETERLSRLVSDLLSLGRVEQAERLRPTAAVDLSALVAQVAAVLEPVAARDRVVIRADLPDDPVTVPGDEEQLRQVLTNLLGNAIKYGGADREVTLTLGAPDRHRELRGPGVRLDVADQGDGIAAHHIPRLTERFYRVDAHRSRAVGGTGLGLAIVKHIVNRHRGRLRIESVPGQGSRFSVILPAD